MKAYMKIDIFFTIHDVLLINYGSINPNVDMENTATASGTSIPKDELQGGVHCPPEALWES